MSISWLSRWRLPRPTTQAVVLTAVSAALGAGLNTVAPELQRRLGPGGSSPTPVPAIDGRFVILGRVYLPELGRAYGTAWNEGARALESGQPVAAALKSVGRSWESSRVQLFDRLITPQLSKIVADGETEAQVTLADRMALARAWRGLASGLASPR